MKKWILGTTILMLVGLAICQISLNPTTIAPNTGMYASFQDGAQTNTRQLNVDLLYLDTLFGFPAQQVSTGSAINISGTAGSSLTNTAKGVPIETANGGFAATTTTQGPTTIFTPLVTGNFRISFAADQTVVGASCAGNTTLTETITWQDPNASSGQTSPTLGVFTVTTNGVVGTVPITTSTPPFVFRAKAGTAIQVTNTISPGGSCLPVPTTQLFPVLEAL